MRRVPQATEASRGEIRAILVSSGYTAGPAQALFRWLGENGSCVLLSTHPLVAETNLGHKLVSSGLTPAIARTRRRVHHPPLTFILDLISPLVYPKCRTWFGFNCIATAQGLLMRKLGRAKSVVHWNVDFVPRRFDNPIINRIYESLDRYCWMKSDAHVELTFAALTARSSLYNISISKKDRVVPMGSWIQEEGFVPKEQFDLARLVFVGHLVERMGVRHLIEAMVAIRLAIPNAHLTIVGDGPERSRLELLTVQLGLHDAVSFSGFLASDADVEMSIRTSTLAVAPYLTNRDNFSQFADPGKLKMFVGAGIPILTTDVAPFASELYREGAALEVYASSNSIARQVIEVLSNRAVWDAMCNNSSRLGRQYSWENIFWSIKDLVDLDDNSNT